MKTEFADLKEMHDYAWRLIIRGIVDKKSPARHPTFGTNGLLGMPELRTVVLRHADQKTASLEVHTDIKSKKIEELRLNPRVGMHIWFPTNKLQVRVKAISEIQIGDELKEQWGKVPNESRVSYGTLPTPGTIIKSSFDYEKPVKFELFNLISDPSEKKNLTESKPKVARQLHHELQVWREKIGAQIPSRPLLTQTRNLLFGEHFSEGQVSKNWFFQEEYGLRDYGISSTIK